MRKIFTFCLLVFIGVKSLNAQNLTSTILPNPNTTGSIKQGYKSFEVYGKLYTTYRDPYKNDLIMCDGNTTTRIASPITDGGGAQNSIIGFKNKVYVKFEVQTDGYNGDEDWSGDPAMFRLGVVDGDSIKLIDNPIDGTGWNKYPGSEAIVWGNNLYLSYDNISGQSQLAKFDGNNITLIPNPNGGHGVVGKPFIYNNQMYLVYINMGNNRVLAKFDTTTNGFTFYANPIAGNGIGDNLTPVYLNGKAYFAFQDATFKTRLAQFDGTSITVFPNPTSDVGFFGGPAYVIGSNIYFPYFISNSENQLAKFDGTSVTLIPKPTTTSYINTRDFVQYNGNIYFKYGITNTQSKLGKFDGSNITLIDYPADSTYGLDYFGEMNMQVFANKLFFPYRDSNNKVQLAYYNDTSINLMSNPDLGYGHTGPSVTYNGELYYIYNNSSIKANFIKYTVPFVCTNSSSTTNLAICSSMLPYIWNGLTFTGAGSQTAHLTNSCNKDSAATLNLTIGQPSSSINTASICSNQLPYSWNGLTFNTTGTQTAHLINAGGCDSAASLTISLKPSPNIGVSIGGNICGIGGTLSVYNTNTLNGGVWTSSNPFIATVSTSSNGAGGLATGVNKGTTRLTYTKTNSNGCAVSASCTVRVIAPSIGAVTPAICKGSSTQLSVEETGGYWVSNNNKASVSITGLLTGVNTGNASISYVVGGCTNTNIFTLPILAALPTPTISYAVGSVNPQLGSGGSNNYCTNKTFTLVGTPSGGYWSTTGVLSVTTFGGVVTTGAVAGAGSLTYTYSSLFGVCSVSKTISGNVVACAARGVNTADGQLSTVNGFTMYPNPAKSVININVETLVGKGSIVVTDLYGKTVKAQPLSMGTNTVDIANLSKGIYFVSTITNEGKTTKKLIVE